MTDTHESLARELEGLSSHYTVGDANALRVLGLVYQDVHGIAERLRALPTPPAEATPARDWEEGDWEEATAAVLTDAAEASEDDIADLLEEADTNWACTANLLEQFAKRLAKQYRITRREATDG